MKLHYFLFPIIKVEDMVILTSKSFSLKHCAKRVGLPNRYLLQGGFNMKQDYIEEYIQLSSEKMKKFFFSTILGGGFWNINTYRIYRLSLVEGCFCCQYFVFLSLRVVYV